MYDINSDNNLLPCPFCGSSEVAVNSTTGYAYAEVWCCGCLDCGAVVPNADTREEIETLWNTRHATKPS